MDKEISVIHLILVFVDKLDDRFVIFENSFLAVLAYWVPTCYKVLRYTRSYLHILYKDS